MYTHGNDEVRLLYNAAGNAAAASQAAALHGPDTIQHAMQLQIWQLLQQLLLL
jgi:hypothetical protein